MPDSATILVVDDEAAIRTLLCQSLRRCGFHPVEASSGGEALDWAEHYDGTISALVSDVVMPGMNGPDLARQLCAVRPNLKVILISGYTDQPSAVQPDWIFLQKPFPPSTLCKKLHELCSGEDSEEKLLNEMQKSHGRYMQSSIEYERVITVATDRGADANLALGRAAELRNSTLDVYSESVRRYAEYMKRR